MVAQEFFTNLDNTKATLTQLKPLSEDAQQKLDKKFRLEWNFNSNHIEGNTLTYVQTELLLIFGKTSGDNAKREWDEMQAHDVAIKLIQEYSKDLDRPISEADIRELNRIILVESFWTQAITPDGQPTRKLVQPGQYKSTPNQVRLQNGEIHRYASPEETPSLMSELVTWLNTKKDMHPVMEAIIFHHRFTQIHPFDDGNGRVARLVANLLLLRADYTPLIIRTQNKSKYIIGLERADAGDYGGLIPFFIGELTWTLELAIKAAKGESLDEPEDIDKQIDLIRKQLNREDVSTLSKTPEVLQGLLLGSIFPLLKTFEDKCEKLKGLFQGYDRTIGFNMGTHHANLGKETSWTAIEASWASSASLKDIGNLGVIEYTFLLKGFKKSTKLQYLNTSVQFTFNEFDFGIKLNNDYQKTYRNHPYDKGLDKYEIDSILKTLIDPILEQISEAGGLKGKT